MYSYTFTVRVPVLDINIGRDLIIVLEMIVLKYVHNII